MSKENAILVGSTMLDVYSSERGTDPDEALESMADRIGLITAVINDRGINGEDVLYGLSTVIQHLLTIAALAPDESGRPRGHETAVHDAREFLTSVIGDVEGVDGLD